MTGPTWLDTYFSPFTPPAGDGFLRLTNGVVDPTAKRVTDVDVVGPIAGSKVTYAGIALTDFDADEQFEVRSIRQSLRIVAPEVVEMLSPGGVTIDASGPNTGGVRVDSPFLSVVSSSGGGGSMDVIAGSTPTI